MFQRLFVGNPTGHGSAVRNNLVASTFAAEVVRHIHQKSAGDAPKVNDETLPAHDVIKHRGDGRQRVRKDNSVGHGLILVKEVEAADTNSTCYLWEISEGAGSGLRPIPRDHLGVIIEEGAGRDAH